MARHVVRREKFQLNGIREMGLMEDPENRPGFPGVGQQTAEVIGETAPEKRCAKSGNAKHRQKEE